ncbi:MAG: hypothetical protein COT34_00495 [Candidatus Nealsonbacteria bacterium CG08_land_8_20_14_0_20_43_11]|uniref:Prepilin-type N-terminal cleavage/methylation domain-containing protein n=1 Tax=Candidatus Nealsonbacteria bacterium CG08_land_8_20_14_0_20_43_11 TaxID=1974706 RepID=A0A2M6T143_9BACT|nr:MAG: hypothetical protein COT34_00495 [Candidatus Nealsonbacteria bacterium CG08_land_8_20_14_0_20_43_11]
MKGFTFIELLIYSAIAAMMLIFASGFIWQIVQYNLKIQVEEEVEQNTAFVLAKIAATIRNASGISQPALPAEQSNVLIVDMPSDPTPIEFRISEGKITIKEGGAAAYPLTGELVETSQLRFTNLTAASAPATIKVEIGLRYKNPANRPEYAVSANQESSITLRY